MAAFQEHRESEEAREMESRADWDEVEVLIVGSGLMGATIIQAYAQNGISVGLIGRRQESLGRALKFIHGELEEAVVKGIFSKPQADEIKTRIRGGTDLEAGCRAKNLRLIIESASEDLAAKSEILRKLDGLCPAHVVLASNTSCLDAEVLAAATLRPERVVWMHFFFPAHKNRAAEFAPTARTSAESLQAAARYMKAAGKDAVALLRYRKGGAANVIFVALLLEAARMMDEGYSVFVIEDAGKLAFGMPIGFINLMASVGFNLASSCLASFSDSSQPDHPFHRVYDNFYSPAPSLRQKLAKLRASGKDVLLQFLASAGGAERTTDLMVLDYLRRRFLAVAFMTAGEVVEAGIIKVEDVDKLCQVAFLWAEGPFALMNKVGIDTALRMVTERMEFSHRQEINFPVPRLLIEKAQTNEPWRTRRLI